MHPFLLLLFRTGVMTAKLPRPINLKIDDHWNQWWYGRGVPAVRPATCGETSPEAAGELRTYGGLDTDQALF